MGTAISQGDLWLMKHNGWTHDHQDGTVTSPARRDSPALANAGEVGRLRSGMGSVGGLTPCERWAIEARIARIRASLQDLVDRVGRLRQEGGRSAPGATSSALRPE